MEVNLYSSSVPTGLFIDLSKEPFLRIEKLVACVACCFLSVSVVIPYVVPPYVFNRVCFGVS